MLPNLLLSEGSLSLSAMDKDDLGRAVEGEGDEVLSCGLPGDILAGLA